MTFTVITEVDVYAVDMAVNIGLVILTVSYASCMEMRETVERMVMVRTTGSDLQPAATGYIYKKESDGPVSVLKMGESEVMDHLSKLYAKPEAYSAPIEDDGNKAASHVSEDIKPVVEKPDDDGHIKGIAHEDYGKMFDDYTPHYEDYKKGYADYLHKIDHYGYGPYHNHGGGKEYGSQGHHEYGDNDYKGFKIIHHYGKGGAGDYHTEKYESYATSGKGGHENDYDKADSHGEYYAKGHGEKGGDHGNKESHSKGETVDGYHKVYNKNEFKKDHDFYNDGTNKGGFHKYEGDHVHHGSSDKGFKTGETHKSAQHEDGFGDKSYIAKDAGIKGEDEHSAEEGISHHGYKKFGIKDGKHGGNNYGYEIKH